MAKKMVKVKGSKVGSVVVEVGTKANNRFRINSIHLSNCLTEEERKLFVTVKELDRLLKCANKVKGTLGDAKNVKLSYDKKLDDQNTETVGLFVSEPISIIVTKEFKKKASETTEHSINTKELAQELHTAIETFNVNKNKALENDTDEKIEEKLNKYLETIEYGDKTNERDKKLKELRAERKAKKYNLNDSFSKDNEKLLAKIRKNRKVCNNKLLELIKANTEIRTVNVNALKVSKNQILVEDSYLARVIDTNYDKVNVCNKLITITCKNEFNDILETILGKGLECNGQKYIYFSSSAGQIRTKKCVFIKEDVWNEHKEGLMCGIADEEIKNNINKFLAYKSLVATSSQKFDEFCIDKAIVIRDIEEEYEDKFDVIDTITSTVDKEGNKKYETATLNVTENQTKKVKMNRTDGVGLTLVSPENSNKNYQIRLPWIKGLMANIPYNEFVKDYCVDGKIVDMFGKTHDIIEEDIKWIFTESQFKMASIYEELAKEGETGWECYRRLYNEHGCSASYTNIEKDKENFRSMKTSYQMLQNIKDFTKDDIVALCKDTKANIERVETDIEMRKKILGVSGKDNKYMNYYQKAIKMYPTLMNDKYTIEMIKSTREKMIREAKHGRLELGSKFTFVIPDPLYMMKKLFNVKDGADIPELGKKEIRCGLIKEDKVVVNRFPVLYSESYVAKNVKIEKEFEKYYNTSAVYSNCSDYMSLLLQMDFDGDSLVLTDNADYVKLCENTTKDVRPLYYEMVKAEKENVTTDAMFGSLQQAFKSASAIGVYSNKITMVWNNKTSDKELIKVLCSVCNYQIDSAKNGVQLNIKGDKVNEDIKKKYKNIFSDAHLPYFFSHVEKKEYVVLDKKDKNYEAQKKLAKKQGKKIFMSRQDTNLVDCLEDSFKFEEFKLKDETGAEAKKFNWKKLQDKNIKGVDGELSDRIVASWMDKVKEMDDFFARNNSDDDDYASELDKLFTDIREGMKVEFEETIKKSLEETLVNYLIRFYYSAYKESIAKRLKIKNVSAKGANNMWNVWGEILFNNLDTNLKPEEKHIDPPNIKICAKCEVEFEAKSNSAKHCPNCRKKLEQEQKRNYKAKNRESNRKGKVA